MYISFWVYCRTKVLKNRRFFRWTYRQLKRSIQKEDSRVLTSLPSGPGGPLSPTSPSMPCQRIKFIFSNNQTDCPINSVHWEGTFGWGGTRELTLFLKNVLLFYNKQPASLLLTALRIQITISCCRFLIHWHFEHRPLFLCFS